MNIQHYHKRISANQHKVNCQGIERIETTRVAATDAVRVAVGLQLRFAFSRTYRWASDGTVFCLYYSDGWHYDIIGEAHAKRGCPCTVSIEYSGISSNPPLYHEALAIMDRHAKAYAPFDTRDALTGGHGRRELVTV